MASKPTLFALLIGIDDYHPDAQVPALSGAVRDAQSVADYLKKIKDPASKDITLLLNEKATRKAIIDHLRQLASVAKPDDCVLFHYSGHGSREKAPAEFLPFFPEGMNETLVAYDSRLPDGFDLADKELAALIAGFAEGVHLTVVADSCHSGSITRSTKDVQKGRTRMIPGPDGARPIDSYLDGFYQHQLKNTGRIVIPARKHVALSACKRTEEAHETNDGRGYFTSALLEVLDGSGPTLNYADLFARTRSLLATQFAGQTPQFEYTAGFNPWDAWLGQRAGGRPRYPQISFANGKWAMAIGAVHGFSADLQSIVPVIESPTGKAVIGNARLVSIGVQNSEVDATGLNLDPKKIYYGAATGNPVTVYFPAEFLKGTVRKFWEDEYSNSFQPARGLEADYRFKKNKEGWSLIDRQNKFLIGIKSLSPFAAATFLFPKIEKLSVWENMLHLQNAKSQINPNELEFTFSEVAKDGKLMPLSGSKVMVDFVKENDEWQGIAYAISARNKSNRSLYFTLIYLAEELGVQVHYQDKVLHAGGSAEVVLNNDRALGLSDPNQQSSIDRFRLIASTEPLDAYLFEQESVVDWGKWVMPEATKSLATRGLFVREKSADWQTKLIEVEVVRQESKVGKVASRAAGGMIEVGAHPAMEASLTSIPLSGLDPEVIHWLKNMPGVLEIGVSGATRSATGALAGMELSGFSPNISLGQHPLDVRVQASLKNNEYLLPLAFDGKHFLPIGSVQEREGTSLLIKMDSLPQSQMRARSLGGAIKTYFLKVKGKESGMKLRRVLWTKDGIHQTSDGLHDAVKNAKRILVIVHGIIGESKDIASGLRFALSPDRYDLMLTFDYENLGTPISETARILKELLTECGATQGKYVDFLVHSMGGLVTRWMIEKEGGDAFVKQLFMFGTPNGGSAFSKLAPVLNGLIALAANIAHPGMGSLVAASQVFGKYQLTRTLADMDKDSDILRLLNQRDTFSTQYSIIAGNVFGKKKSDDGGFFNDFLTKVINLTGNLIYKEPNDVAVAVNSILSPDESPVTKNYQTDCNHLIYFSDPESLTLAKKLIYPLK